jgi:hypothetical protein
MRGSGSGGMWLKLDLNIWPGRRHEKREGERKRISKKTCLP